MAQKGSAGVRASTIAMVLALLAANLLAVACIWNFRGLSSGLHSGDLAAIYLTQGQFVLLAAWCAWGTGRATTRWLIAVASLAAVTLTAGCLAVQTLDHFDDFVAVASGGGVMLAGWYALFLPLRSLLGWRLSFELPTTRPSRGQFRLKHWLVWTAALGLPLAISRLLYPECLLEFLLACTFAALLPLPFVALHFLAAFAKRPGPWVTVALLFAVLVGIAEESVVVHYLMGGIGVFSWEIRWLQIQQCCGMNLGLAAGLLGNLLILRLMGMRFVSGRSESLRQQLAGSRRIAVARGLSPKYEVLSTEYDVPA